MQLEFPTEALLLSRAGKQMKDCKAEVGTARQKSTQGGHTQNSEPMRTHENPSKLFGEIEIEYVICNPC